jgi:hypothetical protein
MGIFTKLAQLIFAPVDENGNPRSPSMQEAQVWGTELERLVSLFISSGGLVYASKALLDADLAHGANSLAWVIGDATAANNGLYGKVGASGAGSWTRRGDLPYSFIVAINTGAGTPNAIQVTTGLPVSSSALVTLNITATNTATPVTVSFNGGTALTIKSNSGNNVTSGGLVAGMVVLGTVSGSTFRLVSDQNSAAIVAAAEAAAAAAVAAAASINIKQVATRTAMKALDTATTTLAFLQEGGREGIFKWTAGDFSARIAADPLEGIYVKATAISAGAGAWARQVGFAVEGVKPEWFGAVADGVTDCRAATQAAANLGYNVRLGFGTYDVNGPVLLKKTGQKLIGTGMGYGYGSPDFALKDYIPQTRVRASRAFTKRIMTRRKGRLSASDPQDAPMSAIVEIHADNAEVCELQVDLACDHTNAADYGPDVDIGIFSGCRPGVRVNNVAITGYFRKVGMYWDLTRDPIQLPELLDPDGVALPKGASGGSFRGADGCRASGLYVRGARVTEVILGAADTNANYYDQLLGASVPNRRGASGMSDFKQSDGRLYPGGHHSKKRLADPAVSPLTRSAAEAEDDFAPAALYIDAFTFNGAGGDGLGAVRGLIFDNVRFASPEIFRVRLGRCDEVIFKTRAWIENGTNGGTFSNTAGAIVDTNDYVNNTYGHIFTHSLKTGFVEADDVNGGIFQTWVAPQTKFKASQSDGMVLERYAEGGQFNIADDTVAVITPPVLGGWMRLSKSPANAPIFNQSALFFFDAGSSLDIQPDHIGANITLATTDLTDGTTNGVDGNANISVQAGVIKVKNRTGATGLWRYRFL